MPRLLNPLLTTEQTPIGPSGRGPWTRALGILGADDPANDSQGSEERWDVSLFHVSFLTLYNYAAAYEVILQFWGTHGRQKHLVTLGPI